MINVPLFSYFPAIKLYQLNYCQRRKEVGRKELLEQIRLPFTYCDTAVRSRQSHRIAPFIVAALMASSSHFHFNTSSCNNKIHIS
jgi:hypothetical protein